MLFSGISICSWAENSDSTCLETSNNIELIKLPRKESFLKIKNKDILVCKVLREPVKDESPSVSYKKQKAIAAIFAFPLPFGFVGSHRVILGTKPWVPIVYVLTFGGGFGLIPMIDFIAILLDKENTKYQNNPNIVMWIK